MFCPRCGSLLKPKTFHGKKVMGCECGHHEDKSSKLTISKGEKHREIEIIEKDEPSSRLIIDEECPKCHHNKAYYWTQQVGPSDEPEDQIYKCVKCGHSWRESY